VPQTGAGNNVSTQNDTAATDVADATTGANVSIDTTAPSITVTGVAYAVDTNKITLTGTGFGGLFASGNVNADTDIKGQLDFTQLTWDIDGDAPTGDAGAFVVASDSTNEILSAKAITSESLEITLTSAEATTLEGTTDFGGPGGADEITIAKEFFVDQAGNVSGATINSGSPFTVSSYTGVAAPTISSVVAYAWKESGTYSSADLASGYYKSGDKLEIKATLDAPVLSSSTFTVWFETNGNTNRDTAALSDGTIADASVLLTAAADGTELFGTYTILDTQATSELKAYATVSGADGTEDYYGQTIGSATVPQTGAGNNVSTQNDTAATDVADATTGANVSIDTTAPSITVTSATYLPELGKLVLNDTNNSFDELGTLDTTVDVSGYFENYDTGIRWSVDGTNSTIFSADASDSVTKINITDDGGKLEFFLKESVATNINELLQDNGSATHQVDIASGFFKDVAGNVFSSAIDDVAVTVTDTVAPKLVKIETDQATGTRVPDGSSIDIIFTFDEYVSASSTLTGKLNTEANITVSTVDGKTMTYTYSVPSDYDGTDSLSISNLVLSSVEDLTGNSHSPEEPSSYTRLSADQVIIDSRAPLPNPVDTVTLSGDTLTLKFTEAMDVDHTNATSVITTELGKAQYGTEPTHSWANDDKDLIVALDSDHSISAGTAMDFNGFYGVDRQRGTENGICKHRHSDHNYYWSGG
jgi:hypothetical protein